MTRILVIEDNAALRRMIARHLGKHSMEVLPAASTQEALWSLLANRFDAILLDIVLGEENGWATLVKVREVCSVPVILMSGVGVDHEMRLDAAALGAQAVLQKPFGMDELVSCLRKTLETGRSPQNPC